MANLINLTEVWADVLGYEGRYQISNSGKVKSMERFIPHFRKGLRVIHEKIKKSPLDRDGYPVTKLSKEGVKKHFGVHRLVATAFVPNPLNLSEVNHLDGNKQNNNDWNLEWTTTSGNIIHAFRLKLRKPSTYSLNGPMKGRFNERHNKSKPVAQFDLTGNLIKIWSCGAEAGRNGFIGSNVSACCHGVSKTHGGFKWEFYARACKVLGVK